MLNLFRKILIFAVVLLSVAFFNSAANACSCYRTETVDKEFAKTANVAIVKLQSVKENDNAPRNFFFSVEKVFKGELKPAEVLTFRVFSNCSLFFDEEQVGTEFLFYLGDRPAKDKFWEVSRCSLSGTIEARKNDLRYLENEPKLRGKTRFSGTIFKMVETLEPLRDISFVPLANRKIRVAGKSKTVLLTTDETGAFEVYDLPPGKYKIFPGKLDGFTFQEEKTGFEEVEITAKTQTERDIFYRIDNAISGKVFDRAGKPLEDVCIDLFSVKTETILGAADQACTEANGEFELSSIPAGTYKIVVNDDKARSFNALFDTFYYPNAKTLEEAAEISVGANYFLRNLILVPPEMPELVTVAGRLIYADGKPAADETVQFFSGEKITDPSVVVLSDFTARTDRNGLFTLKIRKGVPGILRGSFFSFPGEFQDCPELERMVKQKGGNFVQLETNRLEISGNENLSDLELKFPFAGCKKAKID